MTSLTLFAKRPCAWCQRVEIALRHKAATFELMLVDTTAKPPWFHDMAPDGTVPVLRHGAVVVADSNVILEYVEEAVEGPRLMPGTAVARAQARAMLRYLNEKLHPAFMRVVAAPAGQLDAALAAMDSALAGLDERLRRLEGARGRGGTLTIADAAFATFPERLAVLPALKGVAPRLQDRAAAWANALLERPEVVATVLPLDDHLANLRRYLPQ